MKIYLVCRNIPPDWNATRVEVEDVVLRALTSLDKAVEHVNDMVHDDWHDAGRCAREHNGRIESIIDQLSGTVPEHYMEEVLKIAGFERMTVPPFGEFRDNYFIHELEVEE